MALTITMKISLLDINHLNTILREIKAEKDNVVNELETMQNNKVCRYRRPFMTSFSVLCFGIPSSLDF